MKDPCSLQDDDDGCQGHGSGADPFMVGCMSDPMHGYAESKMGRKEGQNGSESLLFKDVSAAKLKKRVCVFVLVPSLPLTSFL